MPDVSEPRDEAPEEFPHEFLGRCAACLDNAYLTSKCTDGLDSECLVRRAQAFHRAQRGRMTTRDEPIPTPDPCREAEGRDAPGTGAAGSTGARSPTLTPPRDEAVEQAARTAAGLRNLAKELAERVTTLERERDDLVEALTAWTKACFAAEERARVADTPREAG